MVSELRIAGDVVRPGDPAYEQARRVWNGMIDRRPAVIARCTTAADVQAALSYARENGLQVAVRGGGHNVAGFGTCDGGIVIDLSPMKTVDVDPDKKVARAGGGVLWREFDAATQAHGLATTGGLVSTTGVAGFTLGGGIGWLMRAHGLACDNLIGAEVVTADGRLVRVSETENADLLWGLRGGGGNFGIVTTFEFRLHPVGPMVMGGATFYPASRAGEIVRFFREFGEAAPDRLSLLLAFTSAPPAPFVPPHLHGTPVVAIAGCWIGSADEGEQVLRPWQRFGPPAAAHVGPVPYAVLQGLFDAGAPAGQHNYWKSVDLPELSDAAIDAIVARAAERPSPLSEMHIHQMGGAVSRVPADATAYTHRSARYVLNAISVWTESTENDANVGWARSTHDAVLPFASGAYVNFLGEEGGDRIRAAYGEKTYDRLRALKQKYDPKNLFRINQNIAP